MTAKRLGAATCSSAKLNDGGRAWSDDSSSIDVRLSNIRHERYSERLERMCRASQPIRANSALAKDSGPHPAPRGTINAPTVAVRKADHPHHASPLVIRTGARHLWAQLYLGTIQIELMDDHLAPGVRDRLPHSLGRQVIANLVAN